jgi:Ca2+:H+ antiporter
LLKNLSKEYALFITLISLVLFTLYEHTLAQSSIGNIIGFIILFGIIIYASLAVAHHAELLAEKFGEPYGTLILTMSAVTVEVMIIAIMMLQSHNPTLARDTIYSAIMLDINGLLGVAAIIGGLKFGEQPYNIDSSNSYLSMLIVAIGISMVLPHFISDAHISLFMLFIVVVFIILYLVFTKVQLKNHKYFFEYTENQELTKPTSVSHNNNINGWYHAILLVIYIVMIGFLSEVLSIFMENNLQELELPLALGAVGVAIISASPELIVALRAALENRMQTVVNIALGASLATILLTVPSVIIISMVAGLDIDLATTPLQEFLFGLTLLVSIVNFNDGETNMLEGFLHFILFIVFAFVLFI